MAPPDPMEPGTVQAGASDSDRSLGFEDEDLGSCPGWLAATVATYCPSSLSYKLVKNMIEIKMNTRTHFDVHKRWTKRDDYRVGHLVVQLG